MRKVHDMRSALLSKGFRSDKTHHEMLWFFAGDKKTSIKTRFSHGQKEYGTGLCKLVQKQLRLNTSQFESYMNCQIDYSGYLEIVTAAGHVTVSEPQKKHTKKK